MGTSYTAICKKCGHRFEVSEGGGFVSHLLHCSKCGREKSIGFDQLGENHAAYLKGLPGPYAIATAAHDAAIQDMYPGEPLDEEAYHKQVERVAGTCECGGCFTFNAKPRCPECGSNKFEQDPGEQYICYD